MRSLRDLRRALRAALPQDVTLEPTAPALDYAALPTEPPRLEPCEVIEDPTFTGRPVLGAFAPGFAAFLDGVQVTQAVTYVAGVPIVAARAAAAIRERVDRRMVTWADGVRESVRLYVPLALLPVDVRHNLERIAIPLADTLVGRAPKVSHPFELLRCAMQAVTTQREALERELAEAWCASADAGRALYVDGGLPRGPQSSLSECCIGVVKSHHTLYVGPEELRTMVSLRNGMRSSVFVVERSRRPNVGSWYLRVRDGGTGCDPMWGLVRVEAALAGQLASRATLSARADEISRWVLAERTPLSLPDGRWDRMMYGVHDCEEFLRAIT